MPELQHPNVVGNFLGNYYEAQDRGNAQEDRQRAAQREQEQAEFQKAQQRADMMARAAYALDTPEKWAAGAPIVMQRLGVEGPPPPFERRDSILAEAMSIKDQIDLEFKRRGFALQEQTARANINQSNAAAEASRASARRASLPSYGQSAITIDPETGALVANQGLANMKLTEGQSKDIGFLRRAQEANRGFTEKRVAALANTRDALSRSIPFVGSGLQSKESRQAVQVAKEFISGVLRKDTGAAVTDHEFEFYSDIFVPQWGDDSGTLELKAQSRQRFVDGLRAGLSNGAALARMGIIPPPDLMPQGEQSPQQGQSPSLQRPAGGQMSAPSDANGFTVRKIR